METTRLCPKCGERKPIERFSRNASRKNGRDCYCKECMLKKCQEYRQKHKERNTIERLEKEKQSNPTKVCVKCNQEQPLENFKINRNLKSGYSNICRECSSARYKQFVESMTDERIGQIEIMQPVKYCPDCLETKPIKEFPIDRSSPDGHKVVCGSCYIKRTQRYYNNRLEYCQEYRDNHKGHYSDYHKERNRELKIKVLTHYGNGQCACVECGYSDVRSLSIDHVNGGGVQHRKSLNISGGGGIRFYKWLIDNGYPEGFQTLCMNCQFAKIKSPLG